MKTLKEIIVIVILLLNSHLCSAQEIYPVALTSSGVVIGRYKTENDAIHYLPDTISLSDAKSIFALNAIFLNRENMFERIKVTEYEMTTFDNGDSTTIKNNSEMLSEEMKEQLNKIKSGTKLFFEGIRVEFINGGKSKRMDIPKGYIGSTILLSFIVI